MKVTPTYSPLPAATADAEKLKLVRRNHANGPAPSVPAIYERMGRIRVVLIAYRDDLNTGGSLRVLETMARALDPRLVEAHIVFTYGGPGPVAARANVPVHFLDSAGPQDVFGWVKARRLMASLKPDILHFHVPAYWLHAALMGTPYKKITHFHGPYFVHRMSFLQKTMMAQTRRLSDASVCITRGMRQTILDAGWGEADRTWTVYNGVECSGFADLPSRRDARTLLGLPQDALIMGVVCRLAWYKGCRDAIRILARMSPRWHVVFCGEGPMQKYLADVAEREGLGKRVHFTGMLSDMRPAYAAMDALLFLSKLEPFGLIIAEAMASRVPVFGLGGEGDYREPLYPLVTPQNSVFVERAHSNDHASPEPAATLEELARHIENFGKDPDSYGAMIENAHQWVVDRFDAKTQADAMFEAYELALGRPTDSPK